MQEITIRPVAKIRSPYTGKFGIPRQSGLEDSISYVVLEKEYAVAEAVKGIEGFSHLWLLWYFSEADRKGKWTACVRPPKLGGNEKMGVFATRSPFRPNPIGLSSVRLLGVDTTDGVVLKVQGADLMDGTEIFDIKPYLAYVDCHRDAVDGFAKQAEDKRLEVVIPDSASEVFTKEQISSLKSVLSLDPRPGYKEEGDRIYGFGFYGKDVRFTVSGGVLTVVEIV